MTAKAQGSIAIIAALIVLANNCPNLFTPPLLDSSIFLE